MPKVDYNYRSNLERYVGALLKRRKQKFEYEVDVLHYVQPAKKRKYTPDFKLGDKYYIETKGKFTAEDRQKMLLVKEQNPDVRIVLLFGKAHNKLNRKSPTTYAMWCEKHGFEWLDLREWEK